MSPELFRIGPFVVHGYGAMVGVGLVLCWFVVTAEARRKGLPALEEGMATLFALMMIPGYFGAKVLYVLSSPDEFRALVRTGNMMRIVGQGFVFYGSLLFCLPILWWWLRRRAIPILPAIDVMILAAPVMLGTGRIGCFLAGCCHGHRWNGPWAVVFRHGEGLNNTPVHPAQLYEAAGCYLVFLFLWFFVRKRIRFDGQVAATYFTLYGVERFVVEAFRGDAGRGFLVGGESVRVGDPPTGISVSQGISIPIALAGVAWLWAGLRRARA